MSQIPVQQEIDLSDTSSTRSTEAGIRNVSAAWRSGDALLIVFGVGMAIVFLIHHETALRWADRPLLPRLSLWLPFTAIISVYSRRALLSWIDRRVPLGCFVMAAAIVVIGMLLPLSWAHLLLIGGLATVFVWWGRWTGLRFIFPILILLFLLRPIPVVVETAIVESLVSMQGNLTVAIMNMDPNEKYVMLNHSTLVRDGGPLVGWEPICTVAPECSGYQTLVGGLVFATMVASSLMIRWPRKLVLVLTAITIALLGNSLRVLVSTFLHSVGQDRWADGAPHAMLGHGVFAAQIIMLCWIAGFVGERFKASPERIDSMYQRRIHQEQDR